MISKRVIEQVLDRADILDVVSRFVNLKRSGANYQACCPFHNENTPSFIVSPGRNSWHCFGGCNEGGNAISFIMKYNNMTFPEAVEYLANQYGVELDKKEYIPTEEERRTALLKEGYEYVVSVAHKYFVAKLYEDNPASKAALAYAVNRWGEDYVREAELGYAPEDWHGLYNLANSNGTSINSLLDVGLLGKSESGKIYDFFRDRLVIPIFDRFRHVIGFTARRMTDISDSPKYINSKESLLYKKGESVFGIHAALRESAKTDIIYLVEGGPDVMRLQSIGINNVAATLGGFWTEKQLLQFKRYTAHICFLPDADPPKSGEPFGVGISNVIKNGLLAASLGYKVSVKEIPLGERGTKNDPDSYILNKHLLAELTEKDFIIWYAEKLSLSAGSNDKKKEIVQKVCELIASLNDDMLAKMYLSQLTDIIPNISKSIWNQAYSSAIQAKKEKEANETGNSINISVLRNYGFQIKDGYYCSYNKDGDEVKWSNFILTPLFHVKTSDNAVRLFKIRNTDGIEDIVEFETDDLVSLVRFKKKIEMLGNYVWLQKDEHLSKLKLFIYATTETATCIEKLGWQNEGFYAFGNGIFTSEWHPVDDLGIVRLNGIGNFYLPAFCKVYKDNWQYYQFERTFVHSDRGNISLYNYCDKLIRVFGNNAKVGFSFLLATLFRDIVVGKTKSFPILDLFGQKGSGKSELGHSLMAFFITENIPPNIQNSTIPALNDAVSQCNNALVHIDEFKNNIDIVKIEFLKGIWDGAGRNKLNMGGDRKRQRSIVSSGLIISGQEIPTADVALFSRTIFLTYETSEFTREAKQRFEELRNIRKLGCTHLTLSILKYRKRFETDFYTNHDACLKELIDALGDEAIEDRILRNWLVPLAAFRTLEPVLSVPFDYSDLFDICLKGMRDQNSKIKQTNELGEFWQYVSFLQQEGKIINGADYKIRTLDSLRCENSTEAIRFLHPKQVLFIRDKRIIQLYEMSGRTSSSILVSKQSLKHYLVNSKGYFGVKKVRFDIMLNGIPKRTVKTENGRSVSYKESITDWALAFNYDTIREIYGINLETCAISEYEVDEDLNAPPESTEPDKNNIQPTLFKE